MNVKNVGHTYVNVTSSYKYMGRCSIRKLSWYTAKEKLGAQARKAIVAIKQFQFRFGYFQHNEMFKLFDNIVTPILTYALKMIESSSNG